MALTTALDTALGGSVIRPFVAIRIELPGGAINLFDGNVEIAFLHNGVSTTFTGLDPVFGTLSGVGSITEAISNQSPRMAITLLPAVPGAIGELAAPENQGSPVYAYFGVVNEATGAVIGVEKLWRGNLDTAKVSVDQSTRSVELDVSSGMERFFTDEEAKRLNGTWHKTAFPGETGLDYNVEATIPIWWGSNPVTGGTAGGNSGSTGTGSGGGGRGGGGGGGNMDQLSSH